MVLLEKRDRNKGILQMFYRPWALRRFFIEGQHMSYYHPKTNKLRGEVDLRNCRVEIIPSKDAGGKSFPFCISTDGKSKQKGERIYLAASCADQRQLAIEYIRLASKSATWQLRKLRILFCSIDGSGKTALIERIVQGTFTENIQPTVQPKIISYHHPTGYPCDLIDISGAREHRRHWQEHTAYIDMIVFPVDASNESTFQLCKYELANLIEHTRPRQIPYLILATKTDLLKKENKFLGALGRRLGLEQDYVKGQVVDLQQCSAKTGEEILEVIYWIGAAGKEMIRLESLVRPGSRESQRSTEELNNLLSTALTGEYTTPTKLEPIPEELDESFRASETVNLLKSLE